MLKLRYSIVISGPTASGKTAFSLKLAQQLFSKTGLQPYIINADMGQFYTPLSIGTAKPDWRNSSIPHLLFDIIHEPKDLNSSAYRMLALEALEQIWDKNGIPIFVGGSLFYIQSLFFPPDSTVLASTRLVSARRGSPSMEKSSLWDQLHEIDPDRAKAIHPHDMYRIQRALDIWTNSGVKPSLYRPTYQPPCHTRIIFIDPPRSTTYDAINQRTLAMFTPQGTSLGWIEEAMSLRGVPAWVEFLKQKKLIGYPEIFDWIDQGADPALIPPLITLIQQKTRNYAKRQVTFWKKFRNLLLQHSNQSPYFCNDMSVGVETVGLTDEKIEQIIDCIQQDLCDAMKGKL